MTPFAELLKPADRVRLLARLRELEGIDRLVRQAAGVRPPDPPRPLGTVPRKGAP